MKKSPTIYFQLPFEIPESFVIEYRELFETLYGPQNNLADGDIIRLGFQHYRNFDVFTSAYFDFTEELNSDTYSLVIDPKEWHLFFSNDLSLLSPKEELDEVLQYRFDLSFLAMREILEEERSFKRQSYDSIMEGIADEDAICFLKGIKMMVLRDGGKLLAREMYAFTYEDINQKKWSVQYNQFRRWIRRYKYTEVK